MMAYIAEFIGTFMLILLGDSVVANVSLNKSGMKGAGTVQITLAWGLAVMVPAFIFGAASGAHFNPALTLALAIDGSMSWSMVPGYVIAQFAGAFLGACVVLYDVLRISLMQPRSRNKLGDFLLQEQAFRIFREIFSARQWLPSFLYLRSKDLEM